MIITEDMSIECWTTFDVVWAIAKWMRWTGATGIYVQLSDDRAVLSYRAQPLSPTVPSP